MTIFLLSSVTAVSITACARPQTQAAQQEPAATSVSSQSVSATVSIGGFGQTTPVALDGTAVATDPLAQPTATVVPVETFTVQRGDIADTLVLAGQIAPVQFDLSFGEEGILTTINATPGATVEQGQLLAELDLGDLTTQANQVRIQLRQSQTTLDQQIRAGQLEVQAAEIAVETAQGELARAQTPASRVEIAEAEVAVRQAQADLETVRNNSSQAKNQAKEAVDEAVANLKLAQDRLALIQKELRRASGEARQPLERELVAAENEARQAETAVQVAVVNYDTARNNEVAAVQSAEADLDLARAQLQSLLAGPDPFEVAERQRDVKRAEVALAQAQQAAAPDPSLVAAVDANKLEIAQIEQQIGRRRLFAPFSGTIATVSLIPGAPVMPGEPVLTLLDTTRLELVATDVDSRETPPQVLAGQPVEITLSRYSGIVFSGTLSAAPDATAALTASPMYRIALDTQGQQVSVGDDGQARIPLGQRYNVLWLPVEAVRQTRNGPFVLVQLEDGGTRRVEIVTGVQTAEKVEIVNGLREGDVVVGE